MGLYRLQKAKFRKMQRNDTIRNWIYFVIMVLCIVDLIVATIMYRYPYFNNLCRPWICILSFNSMRQNLKNVVWDFKDSIVILICIFLFLTYFAVIGFFICEGTFQGYDTFNSMGATYWQLTVLITTSNFPDVMLEAYNDSTWYTVYFIVFVIFGVFFLMNVLLAVIFDNYKKTMENASTERAKVRL